MTKAYVVWRVLATDKYGIGEAVPLSTAVAWVAELNSRRDGEVEHWVYVPAND